MCSFVSWGKPNRNQHGWRLLLSTERTIDDWETSKDSFGAKFPFQGLCPVGGNREQQVGKEEVPVSNLPMPSMGEAFEITAKPCRLLAFTRA